MHIYKTRSFEKWAGKEGLTDAALAAAVAEMENGLIDADLGGHVVKKRIALPGRGKSGGARTLLAYRTQDRAFFVYGFAKNERDNIDSQELKALKRLATIMLSWTATQLAHAVQQGKLLPVNPDGKEDNHD
ncbi:type II toxin-antitoxin system RelE/ParE family toxin [Leeia aquatica]|uniref:Type II toxin-antitoxin system RelE/ParE family toxin n=1 Tax=Leeia aquatica TaxID=2725557 RepID=A0A847S9B4_9NEIS|nr:type II toxin-antitoxin system RelE/ParE family toxin [Leeia aquatica]NLR74176.1 type II toxin-antitoxin system RelE/ParE family toxin [Leeia aquatica]